MVLNRMALQSSNLIPERQLILFAASIDVPTAGRHILEAYHLRIWLFYTGSGRNIALFGRSTCQ